MSAPIVLVGRLTHDPEIKFGATGTSILKARVVTSGRKKVNDEWQDVDTTYWDVTAFRDLANNAAESLSKGDPVIVIGKIKSRSWETPEGEKRTAMEIIADSLGLNLEKATAKVSRISRQAPAADPGAAAYAKAKEDIWSRPNEEMPF